MEAGRWQVRSWCLQPENVKMWFYRLVWPSMRSMQHKSGLVPISCPSLPRLAQSAPPSHTIYHPG